MWIKKWGRILTFNWKAVLLFELVYKAFFVSLALPLLKLLLDFLMRISGFPYLTKENLPAFLRSPLTILFLVFFLILLTVYSLTDIGTVIYILDRSFVGEKTTATEAFFRALKKAVRIFLPKNLPLVWTALIMMPVYFLGYVLAFFGSRRINQTVALYIQNRRWLQLLMIVGIVLIFWFFTKWIYIYHYYFLEGNGYYLALQKSKRLGKKHRWKDFLTMLLVQLGLAALYYVCSFIGIFLIYGARRICDALGIYGVVLSSAVAVLLGVLLVLFAALSLPVSFAAVSLLYYQKKEERGEHLRRPAEKDHRFPRLAHAEKWIVTAAVAASVALSAFTVFNTYHGKLSVNAEEVGQTEISAHRGASNDYPENTMAAFRGAYLQGADWIELDVQQSKDGVIFVMHDPSFRRTTGVNKNAWQLNWSEIEELDAGSSFRPEFKGEKIPSLARVLLYCRLSGLRANIELKPSGHEKNFETSVVRLVQYYGMVKNCVVTSQDYSVLHRVKEADPEITTVYVMGIALGNVGLLRDADDYSIESSFITERLVRRLHNSGHRVYAWTVDSATDMDRMIGMGVDNIITNDVPLARDRISRSRTSNGIDDLTVFLDQLGG